MFLLLQEILNFDWLKLSLEVALKKKKFGIHLFKTLGVSRFGRKIILLLKNN